ncbi:hypothetical protein [Kallotenue papyrolyticum]|uniref:hypothetical protein n=1 Tax=Kallotenue papyrolyticum TaxID=1325125 RepID=UPI0004924888|nr:hypothetical protein [Kallotenue papyrolyticum]
MPDVLVVGLVPDRANAERVVAELRSRGYAQEDLSIVMAAGAEASAELRQADDQTGQGAHEVAAGAAKGAAIGGGAGLLAGLATLAIPGIGPVLGAGILLGLFGGAGAFVGALSGAFASETVARQIIDRYSAPLREGQAVIAVRVADAEAAGAAEQVLRALGVTGVRSYLDQSTDLGDTSGLKDVS